jgi:hypothetical protein
MEMLFSFTAKEHCVGRCPKIFQIHHMIQS